MTGKIGGGSRDLLQAADSDRSHVIAMTNAKESFQLQRCVGYLDRAKRTLAIGIETDQKMLLARFETMVRQTRMKQAQLTNNRTAVSRLRNAKTAHNQIRPTVLLSGERDLIDLLGLHRPSSTTDSTTDTDSAPKVAKSHRRDLPPLYSTDKLQHSDGLDHSSSRSRSPPRLTAVSGTDAVVPDGTRQRPSRQTNLKTKRRPSTAGGVLGPTTVDAETANKARMRSRSAPPTAGSRDAEEPIRITRSERGSLPRTVRFVPGALVTETEASQSCHDTRHFDRVTQATRPGADGVRFRNGVATVSSGKTPCKRKGELRRVAKTTIRITFSRPASTTSGVDERNESEPRPVGYEPDVAEWYRAKRRSRVSLGVRSVQARFNGNMLDVVDGATDVVSFNDTSVRDFFSNGVSLDDRPAISYPVDDDTAWRRETTAQRRVRSLTLKIPNSDGSSSAAPALSQAESDLAAYRRSQLRRHFRRLAQVAEQQKIASRRIHIV